MEICRQHIMEGIPGVNLCHTQINYYPLCIQIIDQRKKHAHGAPVSPTYLLTYLLFRTPLVLRCEVHVFINWPHVFYNPNTFLSVCIIWAKAGPIWVNINLVPVLLANGTTMKIWVPCYWAYISDVTCIPRRFGINKMESLERLSTGTGAARTKFTSGKQIGAYWNS